MTRPPFRVGVVFPQNEIGDDPGAIRAFAQTVEALGYGHMIVYDHVVGADTTNRPGWTGTYDHEDAFHEPMVLFGYLAAVTTRIVLSTGVIILPQRQTTLFGKQAATLDLLCGGRLRAGVGIGWNEVEYEALGVPFAQRGAKLDDQIRFLRRLWTEPVFTDVSPFHKITEAGINPMPIQRPIPIWIGGRTGPGMERAARLGDGWLPIQKPERAAETVEKFREAVKKAGRDPNAVGIENLDQLGTTMGGPLRGADDAADDVEIWRRAGATGISFHTMGMGLASVDDHLALLRRIAEMLKLTAAPAAPR